MKNRPPSKKPSPIIIRNRESWAGIHQTLLKNNILFRHAINTSVGCTLYLNNVDDFRRVTKHLTESGINYTTNQLREDRDLVVVIRGVNQSFSEDSILQELQTKIPSVTRVHRMRKGENIWPLVVVHLDSKTPGARTIFDIKSIGGLNVKIETKRKSNQVPQCRRCQRFFHTANYCNAPFVCALCAREHITAECKQKDKKGKYPSCANCKGAHWSTARDCPKVPKKTTKAPSSAQKQAKKPRNAPALTKPSPTAAESRAANTPVITPGTSPSYASVLKPSITAPAIPTPPKDLLSSIPNDLLQTTIQMVVSQVIAALFPSQK